MLMSPARPGPFGEVVTRELEKRGWKPAELARRSGLSPSYISRLQSGGIKSPTMDAARMIAMALGMTVDELGGVGGTAAEAPSTYMVGPVVLVPVVNITLAAGQAAFGETNETEPVPARLAPGRRLVAAKVIGDCMEPEIRAGDVAVVDLSDRTPRSGDLVAVLMEDGGMVIKRFRRDDAGPLLVDNKGGEYRPNGAKVQGVVVHVGRSYR